jgi:GR25 family glycosyltransferase involved in LPS biosynthesis
MNINNLPKNIYVINLKEKTNRKSHIQNQLTNNYIITPEVIHKINH